MANRESMPLLTELEELNGRLISINIALLAELADILCSVSFGEIGTVLETRARYRTLPKCCISWVNSLYGRRLGSEVVAPLSLDNSGLRIH